MSAHVAAVMVLSLIRVPAAEQAAALRNDARLLQRIVMEVDRDVDTLLGRRDLFPLSGAPADPGATIRHWAGLVDRLCAVDRLGAHYHDVAQTLSSSKAVTEDARVLGFAANLLVATAAIAAVEAASINPLVTETLNREATGLGLHSQSVKTLRERIVALSQHRFPDDAVDTFRQLRPRLRARGVNRDSARAWMLPFVEKRRRFLKGKATGASGFPRFFAGGRRLAAGDTNRGIAPERLPKTAELAPGDLLLLGADSHVFRPGQTGHFRSAAIYIGPWRSLDEHWRGDKQVSFFFRRLGAPDGRAIIYLSRRLPPLFERYRTPRADGALAAWISVGSKGVGLAYEDSLFGPTASAVLLRPPVAGANQRARTVARAFHLCGKPLDVVDDVSNAKAIGLGELPWRAFQAGDGLEAIATPPGSPPTLDDFYRWAQRGQSGWRVVWAHRPPTEAQLDRLPSLPRGPLSR